MQVYNVDKDKLESMGESFVVSSIIREILHRGIYWAGLMTCAGSFAYCVWICMIRPNNAYTLQDILEDLLPAIVIPVVMLFLCGVLEHTEFSGDNVHDRASEHILIKDDLFVCLYRSRVAGDEGRHVVLCVTFPKITEVVYSTETKSLTVYGKIAQVAPTEHHIRNMYKSLVLCDYFNEDLAQIFLSFGIRVKQI